jgi:hypothetical protein
VDTYSRLPPEEQKVILATLLGYAAVLWLTIAWEEAMMLLAVPVLTGLAFCVIRALRRRDQRRQEEWLY